MIMKSKTNQNKFLRIITMPIRALAKARDFYVRSMNNYADHMCYGAAGMGGSAYSDPLPRSFSTASSRSREKDDDFKELVRAASTSTLGNRLNLGSNVLSSCASARKPSSSSTSTFMLHEQQQNGVKMGGLKGVPRSASVGMAIIEEEKACEFDDVNSNNSTVGDNRGGVNTKKKIRMFPRSRSYAVGSTKRESAVL